MLVRIANREELFQKQSDLGMRCFSRSFWHATSDRSFRTSTIDSQMSAKLPVPQQRLRSDWASAQSDQSLCCQHEEYINPNLTIECIAKTHSVQMMPMLLQMYLS